MEEEKTSNKCREIYLPLLKGVLRFTKKERRKGGQVHPALRGLLASVLKIVCLPASMIKGAFFPSKKQRLRKDPPARFSQKKRARRKRVEKRLPIKKRKRSHRKKTRAKAS